jgi:hypothetical protein
MSQSELTQILQEEKKSRDLGDQERKTTLHTLDTVDTGKVWDFSCPTIVPSENTGFTVNPMKDMTTKKFKKNFLEAYPYLKGINWDNVLVAGGSVQKILHGGNSYGDQRDVDIFFYGLTESEGNEKIREICAQILCNKQCQMIAPRVEKLKKQLEAKGKKYPKKYQEIQDPEEEAKKPTLSERVTRAEFDKYVGDHPETSFKMEYSRNGGCMTINGIYQIIFRLYEQKADVLLGFDLGSCSVGYDGTNVLFTARSRFCYEVSANIIDPTRRSTTYELRLKKYYNRGFSIIIPNLNMEMVPGDFCAKYKVDDLCKLPYLPFRYSEVIGNRILVQKFLDFRVPETIVSDYGAVDMDEYATFYHNLQQLQSGRYPYMVFKGNTYEGLLGEQRIFQEGHLRLVYDKIGKKIADRDFPSVMVEKYMQATCEEVYPIRKDPEKIAKLLKAEVANALKLARGMEKGGTIPWITENPGTQLTSSVNPIFEDPDDWYADYYAEAEE